MAPSMQFDESRLLVCASTVGAMTISVISTSVTFMGELFDPARGHAIVEGGGVALGQIVGEDRHGISTSKHLRIDRPEIGQFARVKHCS